MPSAKIDLATYYNLVQGPRGFSLAPHHYPMVQVLEDDRIENVLFLVPAGSGKSNLVDIVYPTWKLGHDPTLAILSVSAGERLPQTFMLASMAIIKDDPTFRQSFPDVRPDQGTGWSLDRGLFVTGRHSGDENPSYFCAGLASKALTGLHTRLMILDDLHDEENSRTPESRAEVVNRYYRTLLDRADPQGCRRVAVGRWWAEDDLYQEWKRSGDWVVLELPATRKGGSKRLWYDAFVPKGLQCVITETLKPEPDQDPRSQYVRYKMYYSAVDPTGLGFYWPSSKIKRRNYEVTKRQAPRVAAINMDGDMTGGGTGVFTEADFNLYLPPADLSRGITDPAVRAWIKSFPNAEIEEAWDTALGQPQSKSLTCALTGLMVPCSSWHRGEDTSLVGECDFHYDVWLLDLMASNVDFRGLTLALRTRFGLWHPRRVIVEEKQSGVSLLQTFRSTHIPIVGQKVEQGKLERAINPVASLDSGLPVPGGAASVQGWGRMGRIRAPANAAWLTEPHGDAPNGFIPTVCAFTGGTRASDEFDTLVHLVTRAIVRSRSRAYIPGLGNSAAYAAMQQQQSAPFSASPAQTSLDAFRGLAEFESVNPFNGMCAAPCQHYGVVNNTEWCRHHDRKTHSVEGCSDFAEFRRNI